MSPDPQPAEVAEGPDRVDAGAAPEGERRLREAEVRLDRSISLLQATLDSITDGVLVVDRSGRITSYNRRFREIWGIPESVLEGRSAAEARSYAEDQLEDPEAFVERIRALYDEPSRPAYDVLEFRDGRVVERYSKPQRVGDEIVGRVWTYRDVTEQRRMQRALASSERRYRRLFEESSHALYITTRAGEFVDVNRTMQELFGFSRRELLQLDARELYVDPADRERFKAAVEEAGSVRNHEVALRTREGRRLDCLVTATARRNGDGEVLGYEGIIEDVTERKRSTEALRRSEAYHRSLIENALDTITILDREGTITYQSPAIARVLGYDPEEVVGTRVVEYVHADDRPRVEDLFRGPAGRPGVAESLELRLRHRNGSWRTLEVVWNNLLRDPAVEGVVVNARDVTERKRAEAQLLHDALHDRLTGLPNRSLLMDRLGQLVKRSGRDGAPSFAVLFLDADRFKVVNDSLGHTVGDHLLVALGQRLVECLRPGDTVARVGGDEFAILLDDATAEHARQVADRIHEATSQPFQVARREVYISVSVGIAGSATRYSSAEEMLRDADIAMYEAKDAGRGRSAVFDRAMHAHAVAVLELETDLRRAVEQREFVLHFQPIVSLHSGQLLGYESLLRWSHPTRGLLVPGDFLQLAEETGLIVPIGWWTLKEAARRARHWWREERQGPYVAVNLSATQLSQPDLVDRLRRVLEETGAPAAGLRLELTENVVMQQSEATARTLERLRELGVALMIDDFGMGYSSLSYLHRFAPDTLKIDGSFIADLGPNGENSEIVRTILALADELRMAVVAEGVETPEQFRAVRVLGCESAQGYHLARPLPPDQASAVLENTWTLP